MLVPLAATPNSSRLLPGPGKFADKLPTSAGTWEDNTLPLPVLPGGREGIAFPLKAGVDLVDGEEFTLNLTANTLDLSAAQVILVRESAGVIIGKDLNFTLSKGAGLDGADLINCDLVYDSSWQDSSAVALLLCAPRLQEGGSVSLQLSNKVLTQMEGGSTIHVGDYTITKQTGEGLTMPIGMSGVANASAAYIIRQSGSEKLRVVMDNSYVLGLAVREAGLVVGLDFDVAQKVYISSLSQKVVYSRNEMQDIFTALDFTFMRPPVEQNWIARQESYSYSRSFDF